MKKVFYFPLFFFLAANLFAKKPAPRVLVYLKGDEAEAVQSSVEEVLMNMGFRLFDRDQLKNVKEVDAALSKNDKNKLKALKYRYGIEVVLYGKCEKTDPQPRIIYGRRYVFFKPYITMKAILVDTGEIIYSKTLRGRETSRSRALDKMARRLAHILGSKIREHWQKAQNLRDVFEVVVSKAPYEILRPLEHYLQRSPGVLYVVRRSYAKNTAFLEVSFRGSREQLEKILVSYPRVRLTLVRTTAQRIEVEVSSSPSRPVDQKPPQLLLLSPPSGAFLSTPKVLVRGKAEDESGIALVKVNGKVVSRKGGAFQTSLVLKPGKNVITAEALDQKGNRSQQSVTVYVDFTPPKVVVEHPFSGFFNKKVLTLKGKVFDSHFARLEIQGIGYRDLKIQPFAKGVKFKAKLLAKEGQNSLTLHAFDRAGLQGTATVSFVVDTTLPKVTILSPRPNQLHNKKTILVRGKVEEPNLQAVLVQGKIAKVHKGFFSARVPVQDGKVTLQVIAKDLAGNVGFASVTIQVDTRPPVVGLNVVIKGTVDKPGTRVWVNGKEVPVVNGQWQITIDITKVKKLVIVAIDPAGNKTVEVREFGK